MKKTTLKENLKNRLTKLKNKIWLIPTALILMQTKVFAEGSISTAEVNQATENIKNAVIKLSLKIHS